MKKKWIIIIGIVILLLLAAGAFFLLKGAFYKTAAVSEERVLYTDRPGELVGKDTIDGEVFIIDENDSFFEP